MCGRATVGRATSCARRLSRWGIWSLLLLAREGNAQDAVRGAQLYLQIPAAASCVSCHGPDPSQSHNNILRAADQPLALQKALANVGAMGYLKSLLTGADVADIAAYLGRVAALAAPESPLRAWPTTIEFGALSVGAVSPAHRVDLLNASARSLALDAPRLEGATTDGFSLRTDCPSILMPSDACAMWVQAQPTAAGPAAVTLVLRPQGADAPLVAGLSTTGQHTPTGALSIDLPQPALDFGTVPLGESSVRDFRLASHGTAPATLGAITLTGPASSAFRLESECVRDLTLAPGTSCRMRLRFSPAVQGPARATLQWRSNATNPATVVVTGNAAAPLVSPGPAPDPAPAPPGPQSQPGNDGGGCSAGPAARRIDPVLPMALLLAACALVTRAWRRPASRRLHPAQK